MCPLNRPSGNQSHVEGFAFYAIFSVLIDIDFLPPLAAKTESSSRDPQKRKKWKFMQIANIELEPKHARNMTLMLEQTRILKHINWNRKKDE